MFKYKVGFRNSTWEMAFGDFINSPNKISLNFSKEIGFICVNRGFLIEMKIVKNSRGAHPLFNSTILTHSSHGKRIKKIKLVRLNREDFKLFVRGVEM